MCVKEHVWMCVLYVCVVVILYAMHMSYMNACCVKILCVLPICECMCAMHECVHARWVCIRMFVNMCVFFAWMCVLCVQGCTPEVGNFHVVLLLFRRFARQSSTSHFSGSKSKLLAQTFHPPCLPTPLGSPGLRQPLAGTQRALVLTHSQVSAGSGHNQQFLLFLCPA